jgi:hypothetical protein
VAPNHHHGYGKEGSKALVPQDRSQKPVTVAWYWWRASWQKAWRPALVVVLLTGLLGAAAMAAVAGARRTESAYGRYLKSIRASDVLVNIPSTDTSLVAKIEHLPGVRSSAAFVGLDANPQVRGRVDDSFLTNGLSGSVDGAFYRQDALTVLAGRLPRTTSADEIVLSPAIAKLFGVGIGGKVRYQLYDASAQSEVILGSASFRVTGIVEAPPALVDQFDEVEGAFVSQAATARYGREIAYSWVGLVLDRGSAGLPSLQTSLNRLTTLVGHGYSFEVRKLDTVHQHVQEAIRPQAIALGVFGGLAALALLVLVSQSLAQWLQRLAESARTLRALGLRPRAAAVTYALGPGLAVIAGLVLAVAGAVALSPLAPLEPVRQFDPARGAQFDSTVLLGGAVVLGLILMGFLAWMAWRWVRPNADDTRQPTPSSVARAAGTAGLPKVLVLGVRFALEPAPGGRKSAIRANLAGSVVAVLAVVTAVIFGASLDGLVSHPSRYGWNWDVLIQSEGGYGAFVTSANPATFHGGDGALDQVMSSQHGVAGWSTFAFAQLVIDGQTVPALGLTTHQGAVEPPTDSGSRIDASGSFRLGAMTQIVPKQIELGSTTLRQLGKQVGDTVVVTGRTTYRMTIVGVVTLPSIGVAETDHVSLGTGAMLPENTLLAIEGLNHLSTETQEAIIGLPSTVAIDLAPGVRPESVVRPILASDPGDMPGGVYQQPRVLGESIVNANQMSGQPLVLALVLGLAVLVSLSAGVAASARRRRRQLAILQTLGLTHRQLRSIIAWQTLTLLLVAAIVGLPLGIVTGRWVWARFATSLGVVPVTVIPLSSLVVGLVAGVATGALLTSLPRFYPRATSTASSLRTE